MSLTKNDLTGAGSVTTHLRLAELLSALSFALDMVEGQPAGHCVRCCWIAMQIGREAGLSDSQLRNLYYTMLIKDVGCSSNAARICQIYMIDDITFKRDLMTVNGSCRKCCALYCRTPA
jgi:hypothetical protein